MIIRRIVLVWIVLSTLGTLITYVTHIEYVNKWLMVVQAMAISIFVLPVLFLMTIPYLRYFKSARSRLREVASTDDSSRSEG
jgi:heme/copper-type cytochrome/quinol oxidase subunit 2